MRGLWSQRPVIAGFLAAGIGLGLACPGIPEQAWGAERSAIRRSAVGRMNLQQSNMYLPTRLIIGEENRFVFKVPPGNKVVLVLSPQDAGLLTPDGRPLRVGPENQQVEATASEKGVAVINVPIPNETSLVGGVVYVDAYTYGSEDYSDLAILEMQDATGHRASGNRIAIEARTDGSGAMVLPGMPGMSPDFLRRLSTIGDVSGDERKKKLMDDGEINRSIEQDANVFITRPDGINIGP